jgi:hypothetical protein
VHRNVRFCVKIEDPRLQGGAACGLGPHKRLDDMSQKLLSGIRAEGIQADGCGEDAPGMQEEVKKLSTLWDVRERDLIPLKV